MLTLQEISDIEKKKDIKLALSSLELRLKDNSGDMESCIRLMFIIWDILLEGKSEEYMLDENKLEEKLNQILRENYGKFSSNPEYLFLLGYMYNLSDWYFDFSSLGISQPIGNFFLKKAYELKKDNPFYLWAYLSSDSSLLKKNGNEFQTCKENIKENFENLMKNRGTIEIYFLEIINGL